MPIYEYGCPSCGHQFEKLQKVGADAPACPECGASEVRKKVSASAFVLKGSGWYRDHYGLKKPAGSSAGDGGGSADSGSSGSSGSSEGGSSDSGGGGASSSSSASTDS